jgi:hypothetical protein
MPIARFEMPDGRVARFEVAEGTTPEQAQAMITEQMATTASPMSFGETGGGAATGRPINRGQRNVLAEPRPLESALAGMTKSAIDPLLAGAQLVTGNAPKVNELVQRLAQQGGEYQEANPMSYGAGRIGGAILPAVGMAKIGSIPSYTKLSPLTQNIGMGAVSGALIPEETGKTGANFYQEQAKQAGIGGTIGAAFTPLQKLAGVLRGPEQSPQMAGAVQKAREAGYVIPPTQARESIVNRVLEGTAGKVTTAQNASAKNQAVTHKLVAQSLGLPENEVILPDTLTAIRKEAGKAYENLKLSGTIKTSPKFIQALDNIKPYQDAIQAAKDFPDEAANPIIKIVDSLKRHSFDVNSAVSKINVLRNNADVAFRGGDKSLAKVNKDASQVLENTIENHLANTKQTELLDEFKNARQLIAKTYTIQKALNPVSGTVDARALARELKKGKPLTDELKIAAEFAAQFPKAAQTTEMMGSLPQLNPLDIATAGIASAITNPAAMASIAVRPTARSIALSNPIQNRLIQGEITPEQSALARMLMIQGGTKAQNAINQGATNE